MEKQTEKQMDIKTFKSNRYFTVKDYDVSHGQLLIRSTKNDENKMNIDIIFFDVKYMQIITSFKGIAVKSGSIPNKTFNYPSVDSALNFKSNHLFEITTDDEHYYIVAAFYKVFENELDFSETSLGVLEHRGREIEL